MRFSSFFFCLISVAATPNLANESANLLGFVTINKPYEFIASCLNKEWVAEFSSVVNELNDGKTKKPSYDFEASLARLKPIESITLFVSSTGQVWKLSFASEASAKKWLAEQGEQNVNWDAEKKIWSLLGISTSEINSTLVVSRHLWLRADKDRVHLINADMQEMVKSRRYQATILKEFKGKEPVVTGYFANPAKSSRGKKDAVGIENFLSLSGQLHKDADGKCVGYLLARIAQPADKVTKLLSFAGDLKSIEGWVPRDVLTYSSISLDFATIAEVFYEKVEGVSLSQSWPFVRYMHLFRATSRVLGTNVSALVTKYCTGRISWVQGSTRLSKVNFQSMATCYHVRSAADAKYAVQWMLNDSPFAEKLKALTYDGVVIAYQSGPKARNRVMNMYGDFVDVKDMPADTPCRNAEWCYFALGKGFFVADSLDIAKSCIDTYLGKKSGLAKHGAIKAVAKEDQTKGIYIFMLDELVRELFTASKDPRVRSYFGQLVKHSTHNRVTVPKSHQFKKFQKLKDLVLEVVPNIVLQIQEKSDGILIKIFGI